MNLSDFPPLLLNIMSLPGSARLHAQGLALVRKALEHAGFEIGDSLTTELRNELGPILWGGFELKDPASGHALRLMSALGHSLTSDAATRGVAHRWMVTPSLEHMREHPDNVRQLMNWELRACRLSLVQLGSVDSNMLRLQFEKAFADPDFEPTPADASTFVAHLTRVLAP
jgi:hypothetical protein